MASRKEYEMLFMLNATLSSNFNSAFKSAQASLTAMQQRIVDLGRIQSDITAYTKQQNAVQKTSEKLNLLKQQYANIQQELKATGGESSTLKNKLLDKQKAIDKATASLDKENAKLSQIGSGLQKAGVDASNLTAESKRLEAEMNGLKQQQTEVAKSMADMSSESDELQATMKDLATAINIKAVVSGLADAYRECIQVSMDFGASMSNVEALSGATAAEMTDLSDKAKDLGATTVFTAQQAADAMGYMGMAGWDASQMLSGMDGVISLAAASGEDLAMVSDVVTDNLTAFGLAAADTARFADVLAAAATNSNTNVSIMADTCKQSASVAGALGYSVEDVAVAVGLMANAGVKGSRAGTALKNTFNGLLEGCTLTSRAFGEYEFTATKADGTMKGFAETIGELRDKFARMTEAEKVQNATELAGLRGYNGLLAVLNATQEDYDSLTNSINNSTGAAKKMADIKLDNVKGQMTLMNSAAEALQNSLGELTQGEMRALYQMATEVLTVINDFVNVHPTLVKALLAFGAAVAALVVGIAAYSAAVKIAAAATGLFQIALGPVGWAILGISAAIAGLTVLAAKQNGVIADSGLTYAELTEAASGAKDAIDEANQAYKASEDSINASASVTEHYIDRLEELESAGLDSAEAQRKYHNYLQLICDTTPELSGRINLETNEIKGGTEALRANTEAVKQNALAKAQQERLTQLYAEQAEITVEQEENSVKLTKAEDKLAEAQKRKQQILEEMSADYKQASQRAEEYGAFAYDSAMVEALMTKSTADYRKELAEVDGEIADASSSVRSFTAAGNQDTEALTAMSEEIANAEEAVDRFSESSSEGGDGLADYAAEISAVTGAVDTATVRIQELAEAYDKAYESAYESISGQYNLWDAADKTVPTTIDKINQNLNSQVSHWERYNANLETLAGMTGQIEGLDEVIASFADGSADSVNAIAGLADAAANAPEKLQGMVTAYAKLKEEQDKAAASIAEFQSNMSDEIEAIVSDFQSGVNKLDMSAVAAIKARNTIQAYISAASNMAPSVSSAFSSLRAAAESALSRAASKSALSGAKGYASGTDSATQGVHLVGEDGPELVYFNGGEKVLNARQTALETSGGAATGNNSVQVSFNIGGNADSSTVSKLQQYADDFAERVLEVIANAGADNVRRAYA